MYYIHNNAGIHTLEFHANILIDTITKTVIPVLAWPRAVTGAVTSPEANTTGGATAIPRAPTSPTAVDCNKNIHLRITARLNTTASQSRKVSIKRQNTEGLLVCYGNICAKAGQQEFT